MLISTNRLSNNDKEDIFVFEEKIKNELDVFIEKWRTLTQDEIIDKSNKIAFIKNMANYLLADNFSLSKIRELTHESNLLKNCYKQYLVYSNEFGEYSFELREVVRMVMEDEDY